jgi:hypothetical protein
MMPKHRCAALFISPMPKHRRRTLVTVSPTPRHLCSALFISSQVTDTSHSLIILIPETTPSSTCFAFSPSLCCNTIRSNFSRPVAETPIVSNFSSVSPMLKHHCSAFFSSPSHHLSHSPSSTKQFRPAIVSPLLLLKHLLPATLHHFIHDAETPSFSTL